MRCAALLCETSADSTLHGIERLQHEVVIRTSDTKGINIRSIIGITPYMQDCWIHCCGAPVIPVPPQPYSCAGVTAAAAAAQQVFKDGYGTYR